MELSAKEERRAKALLNDLHVEPEQLAGFSFMQRTAPNKGTKERQKYGPGILSLRMKNGKEKTTVLLPHHHPSSLVRYLVGKGIPFSNYQPRERTVQHLQEARFHRPSLYMLYFFMLFIACLLLGFQGITNQTWWICLLGIIALGGGIFFLCMLMTRFCYLSMDNESITIHSVGRSIRYSYNELRKVNFEFAREQNFTHVMELLDKDFRYRLFYIGRVSRRDLQEITERLQEAGVDATCSLNPDKRFYQDKEIYK